MQILLGLLIIIFLIYLLAKKKKAPKRISNSSGQDEDLLTLSEKSLDNDIVRYTIDINEKELKRRAEGGTLFIDKRAHKRTMEDITGFYGSTEYSENKKYCIVFSDGYSDNDKWKNGTIALVSEGTLLFKKKIQRPHDCHVSNNGIVVCCDWQNSDALTGKFLILNSSGEQLFARKTSANLSTAAISDDSKIALFETCNSDTKDSDSIFIVDVEEKKVTQQFERPYAFTTATIDADNKLIKLRDNRGFIFDMDFEGKQINTDDFAMQIMTKGSICDKVGLYLTKPEDVRLSDKKYVELLVKSLNDRDASDTFGKDKICRMIGEYYEASGDKEKTIAYWEKAIQINPKVGVKRKLDTLKSKA